MGNTKLCALAVAIASIYPAARASDADNALVAQAPPPKRAASATLGTVNITAKHLDAARNGLSPDTGSTVYNFSQSDIAALPLGSATPLNQVLLQAPGVVQDSFGALHVRGDHSNLQYRINGVVIPEAISGFGQVLDTRFADQLNFLTGALPAQYGYRTAGVVDIQTRNGADAEKGGSVTVTAGSRGYRELSGDMTGSVAGWDYFLTAALLRRNLGVENPTPDRDASHDTTDH